MYIQENYVEESCGNCTHWSGAEVIAKDGEDWRAMMQCLCIEDGSPKPDTTTQGVVFMPENGKCDAFEPHRDVIKEDFDLKQTRQSLDKERARDAWLRA